MKGKIEQLQKQQGGESYEGHTLAFHSLADATNFIQETKIRIGWCWDLFSCLVALNAKAKLGMELADERYKASRTHTTVKENELHAAMRSSRPSLFFGEDVDGRPRLLSEGMARCPSQDKWAGGQEPFRYLLQTLKNILIRERRTSLKKSSTSCMQNDRLNCLAWSNWG